MKVGGRFETNKCGSVVVIKYVNTFTVTVRFDYDGYTSVTSACNIRKGNVKNPNYPALFGVAFLGIGDHTAQKVDGKVSRLYYLWYYIIKQSYCEKYRAEYPSHASVTVDERWLNYQNFCVDVESMIGYNEDGWTLFRCFINLDNKIYSKENCCFLPDIIGRAFHEGRSKSANNTDTPKGVTKNKKKFIVACANHGPGTEYPYKYYDTKEEAENAYKEHRKLALFELAKEYKDRIDPRAYNVLMGRIKINYGES